MDAQELYVRLGRLIQEAPKFRAAVQGPAERQWLARAYALVRATGDIVDATRFKTISDFISFGDTDYIHEAFNIIYRALAVAEMKAPAAAQGAFIGAGSVFDALAAVSKVFDTSKDVIRIVDPYMDSKAVTEFAVLAGDGIRVELLSDSQTAKDSFRPAVKAYQAQHGSNRPLEARLAAGRSLHDRLIFIDGDTPWMLTQSLNALASRSPATIVRIEGDTVPLKISAYESYWQAAQPI